MSPNPDDRSYNVENIQFNIDHTIQSIEETEELLSKIEDETMRKELEEKNSRRRQALKGMKREIKDEADFRNNKSR